MFALAECLLNQFICGNGTQWRGLQHHLKNLPQWLCEQWRQEFIRVTLLLVFQEEVK